MQVDGAVSATKSLRDKTQPLETRVQLANELLDGSLQVTLPRKEIVILEWVFDTSASDPQAKDSSALWSSLNNVWREAQEEARQRIFKNHKFINNLTTALSTPTSSATEWISSLASTAQTLAESVSLFSQTSEFQISQSVSAYLGESNNEVNAKGRKAFSQLGDIIFEGARHRKNSFTKRADVSDLSSLLKEREPEHKRYYLKDYFAQFSNPITNRENEKVDEAFENEDNSRFIICALGETQINVSDRLKVLITAVPSKSSFISQTSHTTHPKYLTSEVSKQILKQAFESQFDWSVVELALRVSPASSLDDESQITRVVNSPDSPSAVSALLSQKLAQQRQLFDFLKTWRPSKNVAGDEEVCLELTKVSETLSSSQVVQLIEAKPSCLDLLVKNMSYRTSNNYAVQDALKSLMSQTSSPDLKVVINEFVPDVPLSGKPSKKDDPEVLLRQIEQEFSSSNASDDDNNKKSHSEKLLKYAASVLSKSQDSEAAKHLVLRYFPSLQSCVDSPVLTKLLESCDAQTREVLASNAIALECEKVASALIDVATANCELDALSRIPKVVYSWDQRHRAVQVLIERSTFAEAGDLVTELIDYQHLPVPKDSSAFACSARPHQAARFVELCKTLKKDPQYIKQFHAAVLPWQQVSITAYGDETVDEQKVKEILQWMRNNMDDEDTIEPIILALSSSPATEEVRDFTAELALPLISKGECSRDSFKLLCNQSYSWRSMAAAFVATNHMYEPEFIAYCMHQLSADASMQLILTAAYEKQYGLLRTLTKNRMLESGEDGVKEAWYRKAYTCAIIETIIAGETTQEFWGFVDVVLRDTAPLITQYTIEAVSMHAAHIGIRTHWDASVMVISRLSLYKRFALRNRSHLVVHSLTCISQAVTTVAQAESFTRLIDNFVNPPQPSSKQRAERHQLTSQVARERRYVSRVAGVLSQNIVAVISAKADEIADWSAVSQALRPAAFLLVDLVHSDGSRAVSAGMDSAGRAYLRKIFEDYKMFEKWTSD